MQESLLELKTKLTPKEFTNVLSQQGDVFWCDLEKFWVVTSYEFAKQILVSDDFTCDRAPFFIANLAGMDLSLISNFFAVVSKMMVMSDAPQHTPRRRICYDGFTQQTLQNMLPLILKTIHKQIAICQAKGSIELVEDLAKVLPSTVLADFFEIPENDRSDFYLWSNHMTQFFGGSNQNQLESGMAANHAAKQLHDYFTTLMQERRKQDRHDFLSTLLKNQDAFQLTEDEIISQAIMMLVAGQITTTDQLCNNIYTLLSSESAVNNFQSSSLDIDLAVEELNRLDPAVTFVFRLAKNETKIGNQRIKAGDVIFISSHAVNRDSRVFDTPHHCNLLRKNNRHLSFGFGPHYCIGAKLAQLEMRNCFIELFRYFPRLRFIENDMPQRKHHSLGFSGFERMALQFD